MMGHHTFAFKYWESTTDPIFSLTWQITQDTLMGKGRTMWVSIRCTMYLPRNPCWTISWGDPIERDPKSRMKAVHWVWASLEYLYCSLQMQVSKYPATLKVEQSMQDRPETNMKIVTVRDQVHWWCCIYYALDITSLIFVLIVLIPRNAIQRWEGRNHLGRGLPSSKPVPRLETNLLTKTKTTQQQ